MWRQWTGLLLYSALIVCALCDIPTLDECNDQRCWTTVEPDGPGIAPYDMHHSLHAGQTTTSDGGWWHLWMHCTTLYPSIQHRQ